MYDIYCASCHGKKGDGQGVLSQREKFEGIPNYKDRDINAGSIYHVIMYGKNLMGSHASQLTYNERWQIVHYVEQLRSRISKIITKRKNTKDMYQFSGKLKTFSLALIIIRGFRYCI